MRIFAFRLEQKGPRTLRRLIEALDAQPLGNRFTSPDQGVRLEEQTVLDDLLFMDFAKPRRGHGPGRMSRTQPLEAIPLRAGDEFGEDTAMVVHMPTGYAAIQSSQYGPRPGAIENYLFAFDLEVGGLRVGAPGETDADR